MQDMQAFHVLSGDPRPGFLKFLLSILKLRKESLD